MHLRRGFWTVLTVAALAGCDKSAEVRFVLTGHTPYTSLEPDYRSAVFSCPACGMPVPFRAPKCTNPTADRKPCDQALKWPDKVPCYYCDGKGVCDSCRKYGRTDEKTNGTCPFCDDEGVVLNRVIPTACSNCKQPHKCPVCKGTGKCDMCKGSGVYDLPASEAELPRGTLKGTASAPADSPAAEPPADEPKSKGSPKSPAAPVAAPAKEEPAGTPPAADPAVPKPPVDAPK